MQSPVTITFLEALPDGESITIGPKQYLFSANQPLDPMVWVETNRDMSAADCCTAFFNAVEAQDGKGGKAEQVAATAVNIVNAGEAALEVTTDSEAVTIEAA